MAKEIFKTRERMILVMKWDNLIILQEVLNDLGVTYDIRYSKDDTVKLVTVKLNLPNFMVVESILKNQNTVLPVAHVLGKEYGEELEGSCISIPCVVNADGIAKAIKITLTDKEREQVEHSAEVLKNFIDDVMKED